ncbi:MAG: ABC transporter permease [Parcubacteria group bacterium]
MARHHENYKGLIWMLAKTDFKLRYQGSVLGYVWALLKPLLLFAIINFVFSSLFNPRGAGNQFYSLQLLVSIILFNFFAEGTLAGMGSLLSKAQLVTKIYVPRWTLILASTINCALIFLMNLIIIAAFFAYKQFLPGLESVLIFVMYAILTYAIIVAFSFFTAPWYIHFRDLVLIWEVIITALFYATPVFYPLQMLPLSVQKVLLLNPMAFIIHFNKEGLINNHFASFSQNFGFIAIIAVIFFLSLLSYRKFSPSVAEKI